jgi:hypothetical protein
MVLDIMEVGIRLILLVGEGVGVGAGGRVMLLGVLVEEVEEVVAARFLVFEYTANEEWNRLRYQG